MVLLLITEKEVVERDRQTIFMHLPFARRGDGRDGM
jgi:hypothetical protein